MAKDELQQHLDKGMYGKPQINPDEQREYLGTFRERCYLSMTIKEMRRSEYLADLKKEVEKEPQAKLLINGAVSQSLQQQYIAFASKNSVDFTIVDSATAENEDKIGLLLVTDHAVDEAVIDVAEKYPDSQQAEEPKKETKKKSFFDRLFH